jgi:hypothetical protein
MLHQYHNLVITYSLITNFCFSTSSSSIFLTSHSVEHRRTNTGDGGNMVDQSQGQARATAGRIDPKMGILSQAHLGSPNRGIKRSWGDRDGE